MARGRRGYSFMVRPQSTDPAAYTRGNRTWQLYPGAAAWGRFMRGETDYIATSDRGGEVRVKSGKRNG